jgi:hypothetical protein
MGAAIVIGCPASRRVPALVPPLEIEACCTNSPIHHRALLPTILTPIPLLRTPVNSSMFNAMKPWPCYRVRAATPIAKLLESFRLTIDRLAILPHSRYLSDRGGVMMGYTLIASAR